MNKTEKPWGYEQIIEQNENYVVKKLFMKDKGKVQFTKHNYKLETIIVLNGQLTITIDGHDKSYNVNDYITIYPNVIHRMSAKNGDVLYLECSTNHLDDIVRIEDDYNR